jgi:hypothetical protein
MGYGNMKHQESLIGKPSSFPNCPRDANFGQVPLTLNKAVLCFYVSVMLSSCDKLTLLHLVWSGKYLAKTFPVIV